VIEKKKNLLTKLILKNRSLWILLQIQIKINEKPKKRKACKVRACFEKKFKEKKNFSKEDKKK